MDVEVYVIMSEYEPSAIIVSLPYDRNWEALKWAKENCPGYITNRMNILRSKMFLTGNDEFVIDYFFSNEKDKVAFLLRWG